MSWSIELLSHHRRPQGGMPPDDKQFGGQAITL